MSVWNHWVWNIVITVSYLAQSYSLILSNILFHVIVCMIDKKSLRPSNKRLNLLNKPYSDLKVVNCYVIWSMSESCLSTIIPPLFIFIINNFIKLKCKILLKITYFLLVHICLSSALEMAKIFLHSTQISRNQ